MYWIFRIKKSVACVMKIWIFNSGMCHIEMGLIIYGFKSIVIDGESWNIGVKRSGVGTGLGGTPAVGALVIAALHTIGVRGRVMGFKRRWNSCSETNTMVLGVAQVIRLETKKWLS